MKKLLLVFAHPDDESLAVGGTAAKYSKLGWQVDLVCATRGEEGAPDPSERGEQLGNIREQELVKAAEILGISSVKFLGYNDGKLKSIHYGEIEDKVHTVMSSLRPDIMVTFDPSGFTNHPDHKKISQATTFAFQKYASDRSLENPEDTKAPKLYFVCLPHSLVLYLQKIRAIPKESYGMVWKGMPDDRVTTVIDIKRQKKTKMKAVLEHKSQRHSMERFIGIPNNLLWSQEHFVLRMVGTKEAFMGKNDRVLDRL